MRISFRHVITRQIFPEEQQKQIIKATLDFLEQF